MVPRARSPKPAGLSLRAVPTDRSLRLLSIGDLGGADIHHVGDEAMFAANVELLGAEVPEAQVVALSPDPEATRRRHGVAALPPIGFPSDPLAARRRLGEILAAAAGIAPPPDAASAAVLGELRWADVLLVSGGGNLNSSWSEHLFERLALLAVAERWGRRTVLLGQTLGPHFEEAERVELAERLRRASLVGVRESASRELAELWRVPPTVLHDQLDDAAFLSGAIPAGLELPAEPYLAVTFAGGLANPAAAARELAAIAAGTGAPFVFVPHARADGDEALGHALAQAGVTGMRVLPLLEPDEVAAVTGRSALVVSGRYHPLVFGLAAGVPSLGVHFDEYTRVKVRGALGRAGLEEWALPAPLAWEGGLSAAVLELWRRRDEVGAHLERGRARWREVRREHRSRVAAAVRGLPLVSGGSPDLPPGPCPTGSWSKIASAWAAEAERGRRERQQLAYFRDFAAGYARGLEARLGLRRNPEGAA